MHQHLLSIIRSERDYRALSYQEMSSEHQTSSWLNRLNERGLIVASHGPRGIIEVARPSSVDGVKFDDWDYDCGIAVGFADGEVFINSNAPSAIITRKRQPIRWHVEISMQSVPGPKAVYLSASFPSLEDAADAIINCYFVGYQKRFEMVNVE